MTRYCEDDKMRWTEEIHKYGKTGCKWEWDYAPKTFTDFLPQDYKKRKDEDGNFYDSEILLFFQFVDYDNEEPNLGIMEQVIWAIKDDYGYANFKRFIGRAIVNNNNFKILVSLVKNRL